MKLKDYFIIGTLFIIVLISFIFVNLNAKTNGTVANVYLNNTALISVDFNTNEVKTFNQKDYPNYPKEIKPLTNDGADIAYIVLGDYFINNRRTEVIIEIDFDKKAIRIERDETPKQIGVTRSWYDGSGLPVVSLPNKISIIFEKLADGLDGVV